MLSTVQKKFDSNKKVKDVLILNTAVVDLRRFDFNFVNLLASSGGLVIGSLEDLPDFSQAQINSWIKEGCASAGGPGNAAPLMVKAGLAVAVGVYLGKGQFNGLDAQGRYFKDTMVSYGVDMSPSSIHPKLPTGLTFIHQAKSSDRSGIVYFPNANDDFRTHEFERIIKRLKPKIVYYMYSGLSKRADANEGTDLSTFIAWCRSEGCITLVDSHTITGDPVQIIQSGQSIPEFHLLKPLLPELDLFFTSSDEAKMIVNTLISRRIWSDHEESENIKFCLESLTEKFWRKDNRVRLFGITTSTGAYAIHTLTNGNKSDPFEIRSPFIVSEKVDLVGAGDSFRAGLLTYICHHLEEFRKGEMNVTEAIQMGNLFASRYITAPLKNRTSTIEKYEKMLTYVVSS